MVWNTMVLSQYIIVRRVVGSPIDGESRSGMIQHYRTTRAPEGGWGMHAESPPYVFLTTLAYVALRLLGVSPEDPLAADARRWLHAQRGGVLAIPTWGKFWLSMIGLYSFDAVNPFPPEMFLVPKWIPVHPDRLYCHTRNIYQGIAYLYGRRFHVDLGPIGRALQRELFNGPVDSAAFAKHRTSISDTDLHVRPGRLLRALYLLLHSYERVHSRRLRRLALDQCLARILDEQRGSSYRGLSPGNALLNCLALFCHGSSHPELAASLEGLSYWRWQDAEEGIRFAGARSQSWDTAFALDCLADLPEQALGEKSRAAASRAYEWLRDAQLTDELGQDGTTARDPVLGGWCFSDGTDRWPVSDCAAEAVAALVRSASLVPEQVRIDRQRLREATEFILYRQNNDGGFATYERSRAPSWLEDLNPSEMFSRCMVEHSYIECTGSALHAFALLRPFCDRSLAKRIDSASALATKFLRRSQCRDGSFESAWGINFTYGTFHAIRGLRAAGVGSQDPALLHAARWLIGHQKTDGGWGEHYTGSVYRRYVEHPRSQPVMTSWALLALLELKSGDYVDPIQRGIQWLCANQRGDGSWEQQAVNGVFFGTGMLDYRLYKAYFPATALARYLRSASPLF